MCMFQHFIQLIILEWKKYFKRICIYLFFEHIKIYFLMILFLKQYILV